jgi:hypothetical protein
MRTASENHSGVQNESVKVPSGVVFFSFGFPDRHDIEPAYTIGDRAFSEPLGIRYLIGVDHFQLRLGCKERGDYLPTRPGVEEKGKPFLLPVADEAGGRKIHVRCHTALQIVDIKHFIGAGDNRLR